MVSKGPLRSLTATPIITQLVQTYESSAPNCFSPDSPLAIQNEHIAKQGYVRNALDRPLSPGTKDNRARGIPLPQLLPPLPAFRASLVSPTSRPAQRGEAPSPPPSYRLGKEYPEYKFWFPQDNRKLTKQSVMVQVLTPL